MGRTLTIPPAVAGTLCLTPAVIARYRTRKIPLNRVDWPVFALLGLSLLAAGTVWQWEAYGNGLLVLVFVPVLLWAAVRALVRDAQGLQVVAGALFLGGLLAALWGLGAWTSGNGTAVDGVRRLVGPSLFPQPHGALSCAHPVSWFGNHPGGSPLAALVALGSHGLRAAGARSDRKPRRPAVGVAGWRADLWLAGAAPSSRVGALAARAKRRLRKGRVRWLLGSSV